MGTDPPSGWDTENRHLIGMPNSMQNDPHAQQSGFLEHLCNRCAAIPWTELTVNPRYSADGDLRPIVEESREKLWASPCRMCRLFGTVKAFGWLKYIGWVPAAPGSRFKGRLCFFPGEGVTPPKVAHPDLYGYLGILEDVEHNLPFPRPNPDYVDLGIVRGWLNDCTSSHGTACQHDDSNKLQGMRVIDCETLLIIPAPVSCFSYVALSYVWGPPTEFAEEAYVFPTLPALRSRTIEDAITVTKRLGFRFLWIDRYCINQNDPEHKMQQIRQMGAIYSSAALTIIAAAGSGPKHGLPGVSLPRQFAMPHGQVVGSIGLVLTTVAAAEHVYNSTWAYRAWTFQEGYLSRRRLFFTDQTTLFVCGQDLKADIVAEDYMLGDIHSHRILHLFLPWNSPMPATDDFNTQSKNLTTAGRHMKAFSERKLTYGSDGLNAILGILDQLSARKEDPVYHIWGVPFAAYNREMAGSAGKRVSYEMALTWYHQEPCKRRAGFPTWSSVAWDGPTTYSYQDQMMVPDDVDIRILCGNGSWSLDEYVESGRVLTDSGASDAPANLELVQTTIIPIRLVVVGDGESVAVVLQLESDIEVLVDAALDEVGQSIEGEFVGVIVYRDYQSRRMLIMVVMPKEDCYERVGFVIFDEDYIEFDKVGNGWVLDCTTGEPITDMEILKGRLERPVRFVGEEKKTIVLA